MGVPHKHSVVVFEWSRHTDNCLVSFLQELLLQVCIPGLHLSLGVFDCLWTLLEEACTELDLRLAIELGGLPGPGGVTSPGTLFLCHGWCLRPPTLSF